MTLQAALEEHNRAMSAYELVLGAMLGGYLGLTISRNGLLGGTHLDLGYLLFFLCLFALCVRNATDRFLRRDYLGALKNGIPWGSGAIGAVVISPRLNVDPWVLATIVCVWSLFALFEMWIAFVRLLLSEGSKTDD